MSPGSRCSHFLCSTLGLWEHITKVDSMEGAAYQRGKACCVYLEGGCNIERGVGSGDIPRTHSWEKNMVTQVDPVMGHKRILEDGSD